MKNQITKLSSVLVCLLLFAGCATYTEYLNVTSSPAGARVFRSGPYFVGSQPSGRHLEFMGQTPLRYYLPNFKHEMVYVIWPDGEVSGWKQAPASSDGTLYFVKQYGGSGASSADLPEWEVRPVIATQKSISYPNQSFSLSAQVEDDPAKGDAIMGNGDGLIQKGEAFDLVVVVRNVSTAMMKSVTCTLILPVDKSIKTYSELRYDVSELAPAAGITNRFNLAVPLGATITTELECALEVKEGGGPGAEYLNYVLPTDLGISAEDEHLGSDKAMANHLGKGGEIQVDTPEVTPGSRVVNMAAVPGDDKVGISPTGNVTVIGRVNSPGEIRFSVDQALTLSAAIEQAGGFGRSANKRAVLITHHLADGSTQTRKVDVYSKGAAASAKDDILLESGDIVFVPESMF